MAACEKYNKRQLHFAIVECAPEESMNRGETRSPDQIVAASEAEWEANKTDCNHFVKAVAGVLGVNLFGPNDNADAIIDKLANAPGWQSLPSRAAVEADAAAGWFIIAGLRSGEFSPPRAHGHAVVVVQGDDPNHPGFPMAYWGTLGSIGRKDASIRYAFIPGPDLDAVHYFGTQLP